MGMVLTADSIYMSYNGHELLKGVYIECKCGETIGLLGLNGCGKSTLLKIIFGSLKADHAFIRIGDKNISTSGYRSGLIRMLHQDAFLPKSMTVKGLLKLEGMKKSDDPIIRTILDKKIGELSLGISRYLESFILLNSHAPFIILDEPFVGLSPLLCEQLMTLISNSKKLKGIIISDHNYKYVNDVADKLMYLSDGYISQIENIEILSGIYFR